MSIDAGMYEVLKELILKELSQAALGELILSLKP